MVLSVHMSNRERGEYRSITQGRHRYFFNAFMRFFARRDKSSTLTSNVGSNNVGAQKEFAECSAAWKTEGIEEHPIQQGFRWKFNPPAAPHCGGVWERMIRNR